MRLDKYLKISRLIKRRVIAKEASDRERVLVNGITAKPSHRLLVGDVITLNLGMRSTRFLVTSLLSQKDILMYELLREEKL